MECFVPRETTGLEPHSCAYLFTQQVQTIRVAEIFFGVKHLQEEGNSGVTDIAEVAPQGCSAWPCCQALLPGRSEFISRDRQGGDTVSVNRRARSEGSKPEW